MAKRLITLALVVCAIAGLAEMWMDSTLCLATPIDNNYDQSVEAICNGTGDIRAFFRSINLTEDFRVMASLEDEGLIRRYYHVRLAPRVVPILRQQLLTQWTFGHFNRATYENDVSARLKHSRNLPAWWNQSASADTDHIMLARAGDPVWFIVMRDDGDTCLMWVN